MQCKKRGFPGNLCVLALASLTFFGSCSKKAELGTKDNPLRMYFTPSQDADRVFTRSTEITDFLQKETGLYFKTAVPTSYIAVVEAFGTNKTDIAFLNTFGYLLASEKYGAEAKLRVLRFGRDTYQGQIIARTDSNISKVEDLVNKKFAFTDPSSTSGYLFPSKLLKDHHVQLGSTVFANKHDNVVTMLYQKQVDAGATFYSPPEGGKIQDARRLVKTQFPDVEQKIKIVALTDPIPNDPVTFRKGMPEDQKAKIAAALLKFAQSEEGKRTLADLYDISGMTQTTDKDYDGIRETIKSLGTDVGSFVK